MLTLTFGTSALVSCIVLAYALFQAIGGILSASNSIESGSGLSLWHGLLFVGLLISATLAYFLFSLYEKIDTLLEKRQRMEKVADQE